MKQQRWDHDAQWQETDLEAGWRVKERFAVQGDRRVVIELQIGPTCPSDPPKGGITARLLRQIKVGQLASGLEDVVTEYFGAQAAHHLFKSQGWSRTKRPRGQQRGRRAQDSYYAELARDYALLCQAGERKPIQALFEVRGTPIPRLRSHLHLARVNGFLSDTGQGRYGGTLTPKAEETLKRSSRQDARLSTPKRRT